MQGARTGQVLSEQGNRFPLKHKLHQNSDQKITAQNDWNGTRTIQNTIFHCNKRSLTNDPQMSSPPLIEMLEMKSRA
jgi:hypothetical protein